MINLLVDEAYAFDYLSILEVKRRIRPETQVNWEICFSNIKYQIGEEQVNIIINSIEYKNMVEANQITFDAVEKAKNNLIPAKEVDQANMLRYTRKLELQSKFFPNKITERKFGY
jgi:hypothetical protein